MGKDKKGDTARQDHKHNRNGNTYEKGAYIIIECTCGAVMDRIGNPK